MKRFALPLLIILLMLSAASHLAPTSGKIKSDPTIATPEEVGLSSTRLGHIRSVMNHHVAQKHIPGAIGLIARNGKIAYQEAYGMADVEAGKPMKEYRPKRSPPCTDSSR